MKTSRYLPNEKTRPSIFPSERSSPLMLSMVCSSPWSSEVLTFPSQIPKRSLPTTASGMSIWTSRGEFTVAASWSWRLSAIFWFLTKAFTLCVWPPLLREGSKSANPAPRSLPRYFMQAMPVSVSRLETFEAPSFLMMPKIPQPSL